VWRAAVLTWRSLEKRRVLLPPAGSSEALNVCTTPPDW
jgi:hypothetical protein